MSLLIRRDATLRISDALHPGIFDQPEKNEFFNRLLKLETSLDKFSPKSFPLSTLQIPYPLK